METTGGRVWVRPGAGEPACSGAPRKWVSLSGTPTAEKFKQSSPSTYSLRAGAVSPGTATASNSWGAEPSTCETGAVACEGGGWPPRTRRAPARLQTDEKLGRGTGQVFGALPSTVLGKLCTPRTVSPLFPGECGPGGAGAVGIHTREETCICRKLPTHRAGECPANVVRKGVAGAEGAAAQMETDCEARCV